jgi:hypothetical protein
MEVYVIEATQTNIQDGWGSNELAYTGLNGLEVVFLTVLDGS